jgi:hypothetical protein
MHYAGLKDPKVYLYNSNIAILNLLKIVDSKFFGLTMYKDKKDIMSSTNTIINHIPCIYDCNTRIYWDTSENAYLEEFTKMKHICPNRSNGKPITNNNTAVPVAKSIIIINLQNNQNPKCPISSNCLQDQLQIFKRNTRYCQILFLKQMVKFMAHKEIGI